MHADSAALALEEGFYQRVALSGHAEINPDYLSRYLRRTVDLVIQVAKVGGDRRRVTELWWPAKRSEEHTSELQSLMRISYAVFCLKKKHQHDLERAHQ